MILTILLGFVASIFSGFSLLLGNYAAINSNILGAITTVIDAISNFSYLIPAGALVLCLTIVVGFEFVVWSFAGAVWIYRHIPFIGH